MEETISNVNPLFEHAVFSNFMSTMGDEVQGALKSPIWAYCLYEYVVDSISTPVICGISVGPYFPEVDEYLGVTKQTDSKVLINPRYDLVLEAESHIVDLLGMIDEFKLFKG